MSHTEMQDVTYYSGHVIEVNGKRYIPKRTCRNLSTNLGFKCSSCGGKTDYCTDDDSCGLCLWDMDFCPFCGAEVVDE